MHVPSYDKTKKHRHSIITANMWVALEIEGLIVASQCWVGLDSGQPQSEGVHRQSISKSIPFINLILSRN